MKILYIISTLVAADGVTSFLMNYLKNMDLTNLDITIACTTKNANEEHVSFCNNNGIKIVNVSHPSEMGLKQFIKNVKNFVAEYNDFDIIHCNTVTTSYFFLKEFKKYNVPIRIMHSHSTKHGETFIKNIRNSIIAKLAIKLCNTYFACSDLAGKYMFNKKVYTLIPNAINVNKFSYNDLYNQRLKDEYKIEKNTLVIGFIGRLAKQKNPMFLLEISKELKNKNVSFIMFIVGKGELFDALQNKIDEYGLNDSICLINGTTTPEKWYSLFDIFLLPSIYEGLPVVAIEAQACGCYTLCSSNCTKELIQSNHAKLLDLNTTLWVNEIINQKQFDKYSPINNEYNIEISAKKLLTKYQGLVNKNE